MSDSETSDASVKPLRPSRGRPPAPSLRTAESNRPWLRFYSTHEVLIVLLVFIVIVLGEELLGHVLLGLLGSLALRLLLRGGASASGGCFACHFRVRVWDEFG